MPHDTLGEMVVACVVPHVGTDLSEDGIRAFAKQTLASDKVPRRMVFLAKQDLATTGTAEIKTADLRALVGKQLAAETA